MAKPERFKFAERIDSMGQKGHAPALSLRLAYRKKILEREGLLDTGAAISVLPYSIGKVLGADWSAPAPRIRLAGNLAGLEACGIVIAAKVAMFE